MCLAGRHGFMMLQLFFQLGAISTGRTTFLHAGEGTTNFGGTRHACGSRHSGQGSGAHGAHGRAHATSHTTGHRGRRSRRHCRPRHHPTHLLVSDFAALGILVGVHCLATISHGGLFRSFAMFSGIRVSRFAVHGFMPCHATRCHHGVNIATLFKLQNN